MSTRSRIGIEREDGSIDSIYVHMDGYFESVGKTLLEHYSDRAKVEQLIALGSLSSLGEEIGEKHDFNWRRDYVMNFEAANRDPRDKFCSSYARDREEKDVAATKSSDRSDFLRLADQSDGEYAYLFDLSGAWVAVEAPGPGRRMTRLTAKRCVR